MAHEDLHRDQAVDGSSDRAFGLVFACVFLLITAWPLFYDETPRWWALGIATAFALISLTKPSLLAGLNRQWTKLGILLGKVVSPIALAILFYGIFTPLGTILRLTGKDLLRLKLNPSAKSYWLRREPPGPPPNSMTNQF